MGAGAALRADQGCAPHRRHPESCHAHARVHLVSGHRAAAGGGECGAGLCPLSSARVERALLQASPARAGLGWADYQVRPERAIVRHWQLVLLAYTCSLLVGAIPSAPASTSTVPATSPSPTPQATGGGKIGPRPSPPVRGAGRLGPPPPAGVRA